jgi:hypothetical protein
MSRFFLTFFAYLMAFQIGLASVGVPIYEHLCKMKEKTTVTILSAYECCCEVQAQKFKARLGCDLEMAVVDKDCCDTKIQLLQDQTDKYFPKDFKFEFLEKFVSDFFFFEFEIVEKILGRQEKIALLYGADLPPPDLYGRHLLIFIQLFRL